MAAELLDIYAQRAAKEALPLSDKESTSCSATASVWKPRRTGLRYQCRVKRRCQPLAMDRLVCGDVGFGKTEVAMRAAFLAVENGKQVAVLVPPPARSATLITSATALPTGRYASRCCHVFAVPKSKRRSLEQASGG